MSDPTLKHVDSSFRLPNNYSLIMPEPLGPPGPSASHLAEFYAQIKEKSNASASINSSFPNSSRLLAIPESVRGRQVTRQPSLNTFTSFTPSVMDLPYILGPRDFQSTVECYEELLAKADKYSRALNAVAEAASDFGQALEESVKSPKINYRKEVSEGLVNAAGLQYIIGTNELILARTLKESFRAPLAEALAKVKLDYKANHEYYQQEVREKTKTLRQKELENIKLSKLKTRNLNAYKSNLVQLTNQVDEIDRLKHDYYHEVNAILEHFSGDQLVLKTGSFVRAQLEIYEGIARKGWSGGGLDELLAIAPDLFGSTSEPEHQVDTDDLLFANDSIHSDNDDTIDAINQEDPPIASPASVLEHSSPVHYSEHESCSSPVDTSFELPKIGNSDLGLYRSSRLPVEEH